VLIAFLKDGKVLICYPFSSTGHTKSKTDIYGRYEQTLVCLHLQDKASQFPSIWVVLTRIMMSTNIKAKNVIESDLPSSKILLAESDLVEVDRIKDNINPKFQNRIHNVKNYNELLLEVSKGVPQLVILGRIDKLNYFEVCQSCHKIRAELPIVLISRQEIINYSFREVVKTYGVTEIISNDFSKLDQLIEALDLLQQPAKPSSPRTFVTGAMMLSELGEIVTLSNNYFGPLAQGNYWRKAHVRVVEGFPFVQSWSSDHFSKLSCNDNILEHELTVKEIQSLQAWVNFFIEECERIIIGFREILNSSDLSPLAKQLLDNPS
jgi:hypothetical protein